MEICILSGAPPSIHDAVGDYSWRLAQELSSQFSVAFVAPWAGELVACADVSSIQTYQVKEGWGFEVSREVYQIVRRLNPAVVLVHYVPQLHGWNGAKPFFSMLLLALSWKGYRIVTVAHEISAPFGPSPKLMLWATIHQLVFRPILAASRRIILTTTTRRDLLQRWFPRRSGDFHQIPISSTIPVISVDAANPRKLREQLRISPEELVISTFGSVIGPATTRLERLFTWCIAEGKPVRFVVMGKAGEALRRRLAHCPEICERMIVTGPLGHDTVSGYLSISDVYVVFFPDGASTRRTSLMVGLAHGVPTISNAGILTDSLLKSSGAIYFVDSLTEEGEIRGLRRLSMDPELRNHLGKRGQAFYEEHFSWEKTRASYVRVLQEALARE